MADKIQTEKVSPRYEPKSYEIEVYIVFHPSGQPFVTAGIVGSSYSISPPSVTNGGKVKRFVFEVQAPDLAAPSQITKG